MGAETLAQFANDPGTDPGYVAFYGSVIDSADSDVTALWAAVPPRPGLALLFEVTEVRAGEIGSTVVIHTPGGTQLSGDCSVGVVTGEQFVIAQRGSDGHLAAGMCTFFPGVLGQVATEFEAAFGPARAPDPNIPAASLGDGATRPPDTESPGALERYNEHGGTTATPVTTDLPESGEEAEVEATPVLQTERSQTQIWLISGAVLGAAIALLVIRDRRQRGGRQST